MAIFGTIITGIVSLVSRWFDNKEKVSDAKAASEMKAMENVTEYDLVAQKNMKFSWKDEFLIFVHTFLIWGYIIPSDELHTSLNLLWYKLGTAPMWWQVIYGGMVISTFGLRFMQSSILKRGNK